MPDLRATMNRTSLFLRLQNPWLWLGAGLMAIATRGLFLDVMDVDASQYASISMEMAQNGHWLEVQHRGADYLDKPPLLFWASASSFRLFGLHTWAYKLPSLLAALMAVFAVYRFTRLFYSEKTACNAAFILASSVGFMLLCNDVRTDTLLMGTTACAVWQFAEFLERKRWYNWLFGFVFVGLAMLAKGPLGLVVPAFAVGSHLLARRNWQAMLRWEWLAGLGVAALVLAPMCWGLWQQFDLHPEKEINGRSGVSGLYFFFWEQSFGRITGENVWKNDTSPLYFLHVYLWAFLPWSLLLVGALAQRSKALLKPVHTSNHPAQARAAAQEAYSIGAFVLSFIALSLSKYKLPHYIFVTLPWAAVLLAAWLHRVPVTRTGHLLQHLTLLVVALASGLLLGFVFPSQNLLLWAVTLGIFGWLAGRIFQNPFPKDAELLVQRGVLGVAGALFVLNFHFYPRLLPYQSTSAVAHFCQKNHIPAEKTAFFGRHGHALDFYSGRILTGLDTEEQVQQAVDRLGTLWLYTTDGGLKTLDRTGVAYEVVQPFQHFQVALLSAAFLNPAQRNRTLEPVFLIQLKQPKQ